ncbi:DUF6492 family protein [Sphingomonas sp. LHG3443-2]|uniref:DUF6492 family protein n=1 Tax=Sphingomonas sp. LHG3443-2 TaxID=2804639 RepID=UPI003CEE5DA6
MQSVAFVTPTFLPDLQRCEILVRSLDRFAPEVRHYLIVDSFEMAAFRHLASSRTILLSAEEVIGIPQLRVPLRQNFWLHWRTLPMRGWIRQQVLKMAATSSLDHDVLVCVDSDVAFVRPFRPELLFKDGKIGLLDVSYCDDMIETWTGVAEELLGLAKGSATRRGHVGHLISWSRDNMRGLQERVERVTGQPWQIAIGKRRTFSEYILYGVYVREVLGYQNSRHEPTTLALVRQPWHHDLSTSDGLRRFIVEPDEDNLAVMIHSKFDIQPTEVAKILSEL